MLKHAPVSADALAHVIDQSVDCVKLLGLDGKVMWMNANGLCAMEIDTLAHVAGQPWGSLWPASTRQMIADSLITARNGETVKFNAFCPTAKGKPRWWAVTVTGVTDLDGKASGFLSISRDVTDAEIQRRALLVAAEEMRHRLKNTYAMVGSLLRGFARGNDAHTFFASEMQTRLIALSTAQSLTASPDVPCQIAELIPALIDPFAMPSCTVTTDKLASFLVKQGQADAIALVIGELAVNSAKHGALANGGSVDVSAVVAGSETVIVWTETSEAEVLATARPGGQGLNLIERIVEARSGKIDIVWQSHGPVVTLTFPRDDA